MEKRKRRKTPVSSSLVRQDLPSCRYYLPTGSTLLDLAIADRLPGGAGGGRVIHIYGDNSTAKTVLAQTIAGSAQRAGGVAIYEDAECTLEFGRCGLFGLAVGGWVDDAALAEEESFDKAVARDPHFVYRQPNRIEDLWDTDVAGALKVIEAGKIKTPVAMVVDTMSALADRIEQTDDLDKAGYNMSRAKLLSKAFRKYLSRMAKAGLTLVCIDQTRDKVDAVFGPKHTVSGGKAIFFYSSTRIFLKYRGTLLNRSDKKIGIRVGFEVEKNKVATPFHCGEFRLLFDYGIDDVASNLEWLRNNQVLSLQEQNHLDAKLADLDAKIAAASRQPKRDLRAKRKQLLTDSGKGKGWYEFNGVKKQTLAQMANHIEDNELEQELRAQVEAAWRVVYAPDIERKPREYV